MVAHRFERAAIDTYPDRASWDSASVDILASMLDRWRLTPGHAYTAGYAAAVMDVTDARGDHAVLKIGFPHAEAIDEAVALDAFPPATAPRVLRVDPWSWAMLLERIMPGDSLAEHPVPVDEAITIGCELLARVRGGSQPPELPTLAETTQRFIASARSRKHNREFHALGIHDLISTAFDDADPLLAGHQSTALLHGDFNPGNILRSGTGWLTIDPKPMIGDGAWDLWPLISQLGVSPQHAHGAQEVRRRVAHAAAIVGVDTERAIRWGRIRAALTIGWYFDERDPSRAAAEVPGLLAWHAAIR